MNISTRRPRKGKGIPMRTLYTITFKRKRNNTAYCLSVFTYLRDVEKRPDWKLVGNEIKNKRGRVMATVTSERCPGRVIKTVLAAAEGKLTSK